MQVAGQNRRWNAGGGAMHPVRIRRDGYQRSAQLVQAMGRLFTGVEMTLADETGDNAGLDRRNMAAGIALPNQVSGQAVQSVKGRGAAIRPAGAVHRSGFPIQKAGDEATTLIFRTDAFGASEQLVFGFQHVRCQHLRHDDALAMDMDETESALSRMNNSCIMQTTICPSETDCCI